jgi:proline iminopeptidase
MECAKFARVVFYDQRSCGRSERLPIDKACPVRYHVADLEGVRQHFGFDTMTLLGHSYGCYIALRYALDFPHAVKTLFLVSPTVPYPETPRQLHRWSSHFTPEMRRKIGEITKSTKPLDEKVNQRLRAALPLFFAREEAMQEFLRRNLRVTAEIAEYCSQLFPVEDIRKGLKNLDTPVTIICGRQDLRTPPEYTRELADLLPRSKAIFMDDSGHFPFMEHPSEFLRILEKELSEAQRSAGR